jgi:hypothetical protein
MKTCRVDSLPLAVEGKEYEALASLFFRAPRVVRKFIAEGGNVPPSNGNSKLALKKRQLIDENGTPTPRLYRLREWARRNL